MVMFAQASSPLTLETLYREHHRWLTHWIARKLQYGFDADDIAQDTFLRIINGQCLSQIREPKAFLSTVARRVMIDLFRRHALERAYLDMLAHMPEEFAPSQEVREAQIELLQLLDRMLLGLSTKVREAFLLSQLEQLPQVEIAQRLAVSVSSVKKYLAKAMEHCLLFRLEHDL